MGYIVQDLVYCKILKQEIGLENRRLRDFSKFSLMSMIIVARGHLWRSLSPLQASLPQPLLKGQVLWVLPAQWLSAELAQHSQ